MRSQFDVRGTDDRCARIGSRQLGVLSRGQALAAGMTEDMICRRLASGRWAMVLPHVYRISGAPVSELHNLMAAHLYAGSGSVVCGLSAAAVWRVEGGRLMPAQIAVERQLQAATPLVIGRRLTSLSPIDVMQLDGLPITNRVRTLIDMSAFVDERTLDIAIDQVMRARPTSLQRLSDRLEQLQAARLRGTKLLRKLLDERDPAKPVTESELESLVRRWISQHGFPEPVFQYRVLLPQYGEARLDFAYPDRMIGVEADSYAWHSSREAFERDRARISEFASLGWIIIQTTSREIERYPGRPAVRLGRALEVRV